MSKIRDFFKKQAQKEKAEVLGNFFKTGEGEYGEGDIFWGVMMPIIRKVVKNYKDAPSSIIEMLLSSKYHEERLCGLLILVEQTKNADEKKLKDIVDLYIKNIESVNNWDLVDLTAGKIIGRYLYEHNKPRDILYEYAQSDNLWKRRIAIIATSWFINNNDFEDTLKISELLLTDEHHLIHKAIGWMLREVGKRDIEKEEEFLKKHYKTMPRVTLRYAVEKFPEIKSLRYLSGKI